MKLTLFSGTPHQKSLWIAYRQPDTSARLKRRLSP